MVLFLAFILSSALVSSSWANDSVPLSKKVYDTVSFSTLYSDQGALIKNVSFLPVNALKKEIESRIHKKLKDRGEAHITVISPPEGQNMEKYLPNKDILKTYQNTMQNIPFNIECVGRLNQGNKEVYYLVVNAHDLFTVRQEIESELSKRTTAVSLDPNEYYPHITIGFIGSDIHGQSKGPETCVYSIDWES